MTTHAATAFELPGFDAFLSHATDLLSAVESVFVPDVDAAPTESALGAVREDDSPVRALEARLDALDALVGDAAHIVDVLDGGAIEALAQEARDLSASAHAITAQAQHTQRALDRAQQQLRHEEEATRAAHGEATGSVDEFAGEVRGHHQTTTRDAFTALGETLSDRCAGAIHEGFQSLDQQVDHAFDGLREAASHAGNGWSEAAARMLADTAQHVVEAALRDIRDGAERLVREGIERLVDELVEQVTMVTAGAATTTALAPLLPMLIAAKRILQVINSLLSVLGF